MRLGNFNYTFLPQGWRFFNCPCLEVCLLKEDGKPDFSKTIGDYYPDKKPEEINIEAEVRKLGEILLKEEVIRNI